MLLGRLKAKISREDPSLSQGEVEALAMKKLETIIMERETGKPVVEPETVVENTGDEELVMVMKATIEKNERELASLRKTVQELTSKVISKTVDEPVEITGEGIADDYIENPVTFFSNTIGMILGNYKYRGKEYSPPNGIITFRNSARMTVSKMGQRDARVVSQCVYSSHSLKEVEFIRNHPWYGVTMFEKSYMAKNVELFMVDMRNSAASEVSTRGMNQVVEMALQRNIPITDNVDDLKRQLIEVLAEEKMKSFREKSETLAQKTGKKIEVD